MSLRIDLNSLVYQRRIGRTYRIHIDERLVERMMFALVSLGYHRDAERLLNFAARIWESGERIGTAEARVARIVDRSGFFAGRARSHMQSPLSSRARSTYNLRGGL